MILLYYLSGVLFFFLSVQIFTISMNFLLLKFNFFIEWEIVLMNSVEMIMYLYFDWMTCLFMFTVFLISSMIMFYCCDYMSHDNFYNRFFYLVFLFVLSMFLMILSPNMMSILMGWDGLGLVSYCLVIYYQNFYSYNSGLLTILLNRIGDVMIIVSISFMFMFGSWSFLNYNFFNNLILFMVIIAAFTKSAQFPFSFWLPAAMAAPTPVSSLVHSSTLVTAGVYLMIRFNYIIYKSLFLKYIVLSGLLTMMMAGFAAIFEFDMKKIIAFSTLSQLGLMMMIYGLKFYELTFFHLVIHAMFKSMMFMCSGVVIHSMLNCQDIRMMGGVKYFMPLTMILLIISNLSLCGLPFMSGFFSKDQILEMMFMIKMNLVINLFLIIATGLTVIYSIRLMYYLMKNHLNVFSFMKVNDFKIMNYSMFMLLMLSIFFGDIVNWLKFSMVEYIFMNLYEKILILLLCLFSLIFVVMLMKKNYFVLKNFYSYFLGKMYFSYLLNNLNVYIYLIYGNMYMYIYDKGWSEYFLKNSFYCMVEKFNVLINLNNLLMILFLMFILMSIYNFIFFWCLNNLI